MQHSPMKVLLLLPSLVGLAGATSSVYVDTPVGTFLGVRSDPRFGANVDFFGGIRYASVPDRLARSVPLRHTRDYREGDSNYIDATDFGPYCWQSVDAMPYYQDQPQSEDCLSLNVWRPAGATSASNLPVMVYIHGGGWGIGGSADPPSWGHVLAREQNVIVVSLNYRLGIFGFLATDDDGSNGMNGVDDQANALAWLRRYVGSFGGNPERVTLFGQGAGGASVCMLSVDPDASGLFQRGILQSGECVVGDDRPDSLGLVTGPEGYDVTLDVLEDVGATSVADLADRAAFPASEIAAARPMGNPTLDFAILPDFPSELFRDPANIIPTQLLVGANTYDDPDLVPPFGLEAPITNLTAFRLEIESDFPDDNVNGLIAMYSPSNYDGSITNSYYQYQGDKKSFCNQRQFAEYVANALGEGDMYLYQYGALTSYDAVALRGMFADFDNTDESWASSGAETVMLLGTFEETSTQWWYENTPYVPPTSQELALHQELLSRWASFAKTGDPNNENYRGWQSVPQEGPNRDGSATQINQLFFSSSLGSFMSTGSSLAPAIDRCSSFPNWDAFAVITESPSYSPTTYQPTRSPDRNPTRRPTRKPTRKPTHQPTHKPTHKPTMRPTKKPTNKPSYPPSFQPCRLTAGEDPRIPCPNQGGKQYFCQLETGTCLTKSAWWDGFCAPIPDLCSTHMDEVCGCNDVTYSNECMAHTVPVNVAFDESCRTDNPTDIPTDSPNVEPTPRPSPAPVTDEPTPQPNPAPITPSPVSPAPITPSPVSPAPITPSPVSPAPVSPAPITPQPVSPAPVTPQPVTPQPQSPAPVTPEPTTPAPVSPAPTPQPVTPAPVSPAPVTPQPQSPAPVTPEPSSAEPTPEPTTPAPEAVERGNLRGEEMNEAASIW